MIDPTIKVCVGVEVNLAVTNVSEFDRRCQDTIRIGLLGHHLLVSRDGDLSLCCPRKSNIVGEEVPAAGILPD